MVYLGSIGKAIFSEIAKLKKENKRSLTIFQNFGIPFPLGQNYSGALTVKKSIA